MKHFSILLSIALALLALSCTGQPSSLSSTSSSPSPMPKDFLTLAAERYSVRHFTDSLVPQSDIDKILEAGRLAPTAVNSQPQHIYVIRTPEAIAALNTVSPCVYGAPQAFLYCYDSRNVCARGADDNYGDIDVTIVLTHMMLAAAELGVGTCPVGYFDPEKLRTELALPANIHPVLLLPFGYKAGDCVPSERHTSRLSFSETVEYL